MFRVRWEPWRALPERERSSRAQAAAEALARMAPAPGEPGTAAVALLGHKGDLMLVHFRRSLDELQQAQLDVAAWPLAPMLEPTTSYVSVVELGMYEMTAQIHARLGERLKPGSDDFERAFDAEMEEQRRRVHGRLFLALPERRYVCFYPMNKRRGEQRNWYALPFEERARMMRDHGSVGRRYAGAVTQVISGSIGFDDWEWGVDLFADEPLVFKKLVYEMRFDEASAWYGEFGAFYVGLQFSPAELPRLLDGRTPRLTPRAEPA
jgi:chlorite dismutase